MYEERMTELDREVEMINEGKSLLYAIQGYLVVLYLFIRQLLTEDICFGLMLQ